MTDHYYKVQQCVRDYYDDSLSKGRTILEISEDFRETPLPNELRGCEFDESEIRRHGQLVATDKLLKERKHASATVPAVDLLGGGILMP